MRPRDEGTGDLFDQAAYARNSDPATSHAAAARVDANAKEQAVLDTLARHPRGMTVREIARASGIDKWTVSPRLRPLVRKGRVEETEERRDGMIVWRKTP